MMMNKGCCGLGFYNGVIFCFLIVKLCFNREFYLFWDFFYFIDKGNGFLVDFFFFGGFDIIDFVNV